MEKKIISNKKGMSLVEVVAALAIFSVLFIGVS
ncbi:prepilin-type N-terminal cleavage/methylation domain-containing protein, partial [Clostridium sp.]